MSKVFERDCAPTTESIHKDWADLLNNCQNKWWKDAGLRSLNFRLCILCLCAVVSGYDGTLISGLLTIPRCESNLPTSSQL